MFQLKKSSSG